MCGMFDTATTFICPKALLSDLGNQCQGHVYSRDVTSHMCSDAQKWDAASRWRKPTI